jgi:molybdopterin-containing oxidoreductase family membrane subunit
VLTFFMSILVNIGMWFERFVIIVTSLYRDYLPSSWSVYYSPTIWEVGFYIGTFGLFFTCYFCSLNSSRLLPLRNQAYPEEKR